MMIDDTLSNKAWDKIRFKYPDLYKNNYEEFYRLVEERETELYAERARQFELEKQKKHDDYINKLIEYTDYELDIERTLRNIAEEMYRLSNRISGKADKPIRLR